MVLARAQILAALGAELELGAVATLLARAADVGGRTEVHLEPPELGKGAVAACGQGAGQQRRLMPASPSRREMEARKLLASQQEGQALWRDHSLKWAACSAAGLVHRLTRMRAVEPARGRGRERGRAQHRTLFVR